MSKSVKAALYLSTCAMVLSGYLALASTQEYTLRVLLVPAIVFALVPLAEWLDTRFRGYRRLMNVLTYLYTLAMFFSLFAYGLFPTVVALVIYIQVFKLLHTKEELDYHHIFLMAFFLLVAGCVLSPDASIAVALLMFLISAVWAFFSLQVHAETRRCTGTCEADVVPLHLLRPVYGARRERFVDGSLLASYTAITLACILMTVTFFMATPRMEAGVFGGRSLQPVQQTTGLSESVDLAQGGPDFINTAPVMRVYTPDEPNGHYEGPLYWRSTSFDRFNGRGWDSTSESAITNDGRREVQFMNSHAVLDRTRMDEFGREVRQVIYLENIPSKGLPALPWARQITWKEARLVWDMIKGDTTIDVLAARRNSLLYEVRSEVGRPSDEALRGASMDYEATFKGSPILQPAAYARLTYQTLSEPAAELARQVTEPYDNPYDKAAAIERFLSGGPYVYSLGMPAGDLRNPVDHFILESKTGHCELFASAMALMLRSVGIPARVVSGYRGGEWDVNDQSYTVRSSMAHLWVEVYFIGYGWIAFDPSPPDNSSSANAGVAGQLKSYLNSKLLKGKMLWYQNVVSYSGRSPLSGLQAFTLSVLKGLTVPWESEESGRKVGAGGRIVSPDTVGWALLAGLALFGIGVLRRARRDRGKKRQAAVLNRDQLRAIRLFHTVRKRVRQTVPELEGTTAEEIVRKLGTLDVDRARVVRPLLDAYNETRFGGRPMPRARFLELRKAARSLG